MSPRLGDRIAQSLGGTLLDALHEDPLSPSARSQHRNVLLFSSAALLVVWLDLVPREISTIGVQLSPDDRRAVLIAFLVALAYFTFSFAVYAAGDLVSWVRTRLEGREIIEGTRRDRARLMNEYREILGQHDAGNPAQKEETLPRVQERLAEANAAALRHRLFRTMVPIATIRGGIDFVIPVVFGVFAMVVLVVEIC